MAPRLKKGRDRLWMVLEWGCHPDCPHMAECCRYRPRCKAEVRA